MTPASTAPFLSHLSVDGLHFTVYAPSEILQNYPGNALRAPFSNLCPQFGLEVPKPCKTRTSASRNYAILITAQTLSFFGRVHLMNHPELIKRDPSNTEGTWNYCPLLRQVPLICTILCSFDTSLCVCQQLCQNLCTYLWEPPLRNAPFAVPPCACHRMSKDVQKVEPSQKTQIGCENQHAKNTNIKS